jgi:hypothetical protein
MACNTFKKMLSEHEIDPVEGLNIGYYAYTYSTYQGQPVALMKRPDLGPGRVCVPVDVLKITRCYVTIRYGDDKYRVKIRQDSINREFIRVNDEIAVYCDHFSYM